MPSLGVISKIPLGFSSREKYKAFVSRFSIGGLKASRDELMKQIEAAQFRIELIDEILAERGIEVDSNED